MPWKSSTNIRSVRQWFDHNSRWLDKSLQKSVPFIKFAGRHWIISSCTIVALILLLINPYIKSYSRSSIIDDIGSIPETEAAMILGAMVHDNTYLSGILADRTRTALSLYRAGKVKKILISGDHGQHEYDEVNTVKKYLLARGVSAADIFMDHAGFSTYDSLCRARLIFGAKSLTLCSQRFHLYRAVYIGRKKGIIVYGAPSDYRNYPGRKRFESREALARIKDFFFVMLRIRPKFGGSKIPISGDGRKSWD